MNLVATKSIAPPNYGFRCGLQAGGNLYCVRWLLVPVKLTVIGRNGQISARGYSLCVFSDAIWWVRQQQIKARQQRQNVNAIGMVDGDTIMLVVRRHAGYPDCGMLVSDISGASSSSAVKGAHDTINVVRVRTITVSHSARSRKAYFATLVCMSTSEPQYEIGHINEHGDWESEYGPYSTRQDAEDKLAELEPIPMVIWEIRSV